MPIGIYNDKADSYLQHVGKFFNFCIFIAFFNFEVKKTISITNINNRDFLGLSGHFFVRIYGDFIFFLYDTVSPLCYTTSFKI